ncbi:isochorismatase family protein [Pantoea sp.]|uniref:isochorismatase family protein n=1 Tax=Pantoea sp. TaxID=69393 RepID=UPI00289675AD|nr:isochorismatase family protein [Pantoea sp.]
MANSALLVIDVQQSFFHREYWQEQDYSRFKQNISRLIAGCQQQGVSVVDVLHVEKEGPFSLASGLVARMPFLNHQAAHSVHKHVHNALTESGLLAWLEDRQITELIVSGIRTEQCCETTTRVASDLGFNVTFVSEATMTFPITYGGVTLSSADLRHRTETVLANRFATIKSVDECLQALTAMAV